MLAALDALQKQAAIAREMRLTLGEGIPDARAQRRLLRARLRDAHAIMAQHRAECAAIVRVAYGLGLPIPDITPEVLQHLVGDDRGPARCEQVTTSARRDTKRRPQR
jgi:hypothetical protein